MGRKRKGTAISVTVGPEVLAKIDEEVGAEPGSCQSMGRMGGRNNIVRQILYKHFNEPLPLDHTGKATLKPLTDEQLEEASSNEAILKGGSISFMVLLEKHGYSYQKIADNLTKYLIPTKKGGVWHRETVRQMLTRWHSNKTKKAEKQVVTSIK